jgi:hypothetical protein
MGRTRTEKRKNGGASCNTSREQGEARLYRPGPDVSMSCWLCEHTLHASAPVSVLAAPAGGSLPRSDNLRRSPLYHVAAAWVSYFTSAFADRRMQGRAVRAPEVLLLPAAGDASCERYRRSRLPKVMTQLCGVAAPRPNTRHPQQASLSLLSLSCNCLCRGGGDSETQPPLPLPPCSGVTDPDP